VFQRTTKRSSRLGGRGTTGRVRQHGRAGRNSKQEGGRSGIRGGRAVKWGSHVKGGTVGGDERSGKNIRDVCESSEAVGLKKPPRPENCTQGILCPPEPKKDQEILEREIEGKAGDTREVPLIHRTLVDHSG